MSAIVSWSQMTMYGHLVPRGTNHESTRRLAGRLPSAALPLVLRNERRPSMSMPSLFDEQLSLLAMPTFVAGRRRIAGIRCPLQDRNAAVARALRIIWKRCRAAPRKRSVAPGRQTLARGSVPPPCSHPDRRSPRTGAIGIPALATMSEVGHRRAVAVVDQIDAGLAAARVEVEPRDWIATP